MERWPSGKLVTELKGHKEKILGTLAISPKGNILASGDDAGEIRLWEANTGKFTKSIKNPGGVIGWLQFLPIATGCLQLADTSTPIRSSGFST